MKYIDLNGNKYCKETNQDKILKKIYSNKIGQISLKLLTKPIVSKLGGLYLNSCLSVKLINPFIKKNNINMNDYIPKIYVSYNDFFTRKMKNDKRKISYESKDLISPCDGKLSVYNIDDNSLFKIKGTDYSIASLLKNEKIAKRYIGGQCAIIRLTVDDYHRYCYIDTGYKSNNCHIDGKFHTVNPVALESVDFYKENSREYTLLKTNNFKTVCQIEVGALMVGKISNLHQRGYFHKGFEKGMFEFGGSTIVLLFQKDAVNIEKEFFENTANGYETIVKLGDIIGASVGK